MFSYFANRLRGDTGVPGPVGPMGPKGDPGLDGRDGRDATVHVNLQYPAPVFHRVESAPADHPVPSRSHNGDAGHDLHSTVTGVIPSGQRRAIPIGYSVDLDSMTYGKVEARSGLARDHGLVVLGGVIDSGYTGEMVVMLFNSGERPWTYQRGDRVAQLVVQPVVVDPENHLADGERGADGFGSTGGNMDHLKDALYNRAAARENAPDTGTGAEMTAHYTQPGTVLTDKHGDHWGLMERGGDATPQWMVGPTDKNRRERMDYRERMGLRGGIDQLPDHWGPYTLGQAEDPTEVVYPEENTSAAYFNEHRSIPGVVVQDREGDFWEYLDAVPAGTLGINPAGQGWTVGSTPEARRDRQLMGHGDMELSEGYAPYTNVTPSGDVVVADTEDPQEVSASAAYFNQYCHPNQVLRDREGDYWEYMLSKSAEGVHGWVMGPTPEARQAKQDAGVIQTDLSASWEPYTDITLPDVERAWPAPSDDVEGEGPDPIGSMYKDRDGDVWELMEHSGGGQCRWVTGDDHQERQDIAEMGGHLDLPERWGPYTRLNPNPVVTSEHMPANTALAFSSVGVELDLGVDMVNHPPHYKDHPIFSGECWTYAQWMVYGQGAAFKYLWRSESKDTVVSNLDKAHWYISNSWASDSLLWNNLEVDHLDLANQLSGAVTEAENNGDDYTLGQLLVASAAVFVALGEAEDALEYVQRALNWYQTPDNV